MTGGFAPSCQSLGGVIALRDEDIAFSKETAALQKQTDDRRADYLAGLASFKAVLLEGAEVVFIVIAIGTAHGRTFYAGLGALAAFILIAPTGLIVHRPLVRVPENALKFIVGLMLTSFGIFWTGEGIGADWPGADPRAACNFRDDRGGIACCPLDARRRGGVDGGSYR